MIQPIKGKLIVAPLETPEETVEGIIIPTSVATADLKRAEVVEVSDDLKEIYKKGDIVLHPSQAGMSQIYNKKVHLWLRISHDEVWGIETE